MLSLIPKSSESVNTKDKKLKFFSIKSKETVNPEASNFLPNVTEQSFACEVKNNPDSVAAILKLLVTK